jgi:hypothetical protein
MLTRGYTLDEFVHNMDAAIENGAGQEAVFAQGASCIERLINNPKCMPAAFRVPVGSPGNVIRLLAPSEQPIAGRLRSTAMPRSIPSV